MRSVDSITCGSLVCCTRGWCVLYPRLVWVIDGWTQVRRVLNESQMLGVIVLAACQVAQRMPCDMPVGAFRVGLTFHH